MSQKIYWNLLVLFGVLCQGIMGTISEKEMDESSDLLARQKRVISRLPGGDVRESMRDSPFVVAIKRLRINNFCVGVILTTNIVITVPKCVEAPMKMYRVYSGCAQLARNACRKVHKITEKRTNVGNHPFRPADGIILITVDPPFSYSLNTQNIGFYEGPIHPGLRASVSGWGCNPSGPVGTVHPEWLRKITVPIISNEDCNILYLEHFTVSNRDICTLDAFGHQYCGANDEGAPLLVEVGLTQKLVGIHLWNGGIEGRSNPDVFVNLQHPGYKAWIQAHIQHLRN